MVEIWKQLLEKTADMAKQKQQVADLLHNQISEMMKQQKRVKEAAFKRVSDNGYTHVASCPPAWLHDLERLFLTRRS